MMNQWTKKIVLVLLSLALMAGTAFAQGYQKVHFRFGHVVAPTAPEGKGEIYVAEEATKRSGGAVTHQIYWSGAGGAPAESLDLVSAGGLDGAIITSSWFPAKLPFLSAFSALPLSSRDQASAQRVMNTLWKESKVLQDEAKANNLHVLRFLPTNEYHLLSTKPIAKIADMQGMKIRSQGEFIPIAIKTIGAIPVTVLPGEFYEAMQRKTIDTMLLSYNLLAVNKLYEVSKYISTISFGTLTSHMMVYNLDKWNKLEPKTQKLLTDIAAERPPIDLKEQIEAEKKGLEQLLAGGVKLVNFEEQNKLYSVMPDFIDMWVKKMQGAGKGEAAAQVAKRWKELR
jgi:TRAP-type C4-dicarboxylate transport system substrate-binding protein